jgi:hypothetical protein
MTDSQTTISPSTGGKQMLRISVQSAGSVSAIVGLILLVIGWIGGYLTFKSDMAIVNGRQIETTAAINALNERMNTLNTSFVNDRQASTNKMTAVEGKLEYLGQSVGEIKLAIVPKR